MKKNNAAAILLALALVGGLTACSKKDSAAGAPPSTPTPELVETVQPKQTPAPTATLEPALETTPEAAPDPSVLPDATSSSDITSPHDRSVESYFDDAVFVGDSIMEGIRQYVAKNRNLEPTLGSARFLTSTAGVSVSGLLEGETDGAFYRYNGTSQPLSEILSQMDCARIFLLLGLNDLSKADSSVEVIVDNYAQLIEQLQQTCPNAEIIVITNPPKVASSWLPSYTSNRNFSNTLIAQFVEALLQMCDTQGVACVDAYAVLKDGRGALPDDYCRDGFVHLNDAGAKVVVDEVYRFASARTQQQEIANENT